MNVFEGILEELGKLSKRIGNLETQQHFHPILKLGTPSELTIAAGVVTRTRGYHTIDTEADAAADDLTTINGGVTGDILILQSANDARKPTAKDGTGNMQLSGDFVFNDTNDMLILIYNGANWCEIAGSTNG